jgi:hypothetical protein
MSSVVLFPRLLSNYKCMLVGLFYIFKAVFKLIFRFGTRVGLLIFNEVLQKLKTKSNVEIFYDKSVVSKCLSLALSYFLFIDNYYSYFGLDSWKEDLSFFCFLVSHSNFNFQRNLLLPYWI